MARNADEAIAWGRAQITNPSQDWTRWCLVFVRSCFGVDAKWPDAGKAWDNAKFRHATVDRMSIPAGVPIHFETPGEADHIALSTGGGMCLSNDIRRTGRIDEVPIAEIVERWKAPLNGWSEDLNGVRVYTPKEPPVTTPQNFSRKDWGARPAKSGPGRLDPAQVDGIALHWPAMRDPIRGASAVASALRGWQNYHMDGRGWADIAYQVAVDQDGNRYELRGLTTQSAANGDELVNRRYGAILLILAPGEQATDAMLTTTRQVIADFRRHHPRGTGIVGHSQIRPEPTACPGPIALGLIKSGAFNPDLEDEVRPEDIKAIADEVTKTLLGEDIKIGKDEEAPLARVIRWVRNDGQRILKELRELNDKLDGEVPEPPKAP